MDLNFFLNNRANTFNPAQFIPQMKKEWKSYFEWKAFKQFDPIHHDILKQSKRKDKRIMVPDPSGACYTTGENIGEPMLVPQIVKLNRIPLALQKLIVSRATAFLTGGKVELKSKPQNNIEEILFERVKTTWRKNKLQFKNSTIARHFYSETECAEIWHSEVDDDDNVTMKCKVYSPSKGFDLIPVFDPYGDLIAFGMSNKDFRDGKEIELMQIWDKDKLTKHYDDGTGWKEYEPNVKLPYGKIPVIYYCLEKAIWADVQWAIERVETLMSNFADTNDYNGSPILVATGPIKGFSGKGETGKVVELESEDGKEADLKYISWDSAPESIKLEIEHLINFIYTITQTPDISFYQMKGLGDISGAAFDRLMIDGHLKATDLQNGMYGECIQRRLNFLCYAIANQTVKVDGKKVDLKKAEDMEIGAEFSLFSIDNIQDKINNAKLANGGLPVLDQKASIQMAGLTDDVESTYLAIQSEKSTKKEIPANL